MFKAYFAGKEMQLALVASLFLLALTVLMGSMSVSMDVVGILQQLGIANPPNWLVWTILGAGSVSAIVGAISIFGLASIPLWAQGALLGADSFGV